MKYTVSLAEAKKYSRRKRAGKAVKILKNYVEKREGEKVTLTQELNEEIWKHGAERPPRSIDVEIQEVDGAKVVALAGSEVQTVSKPAKKEKKEQEPEESDDYESILDGTVGDAKDAINDMENPDYEKLLELEQAGKDRKTLVEFLESKIE